FVKAQSLVLTKSIDLEKGEHGRHGHFSKDEPLPFEIKGKLGSGGFSQVDRILNPVFLGLIMSPVADTDLAKYLKGIASSTSAGLLPVEDITNLRSYFGCLANALQYLHEQSIRHKDIKPQNILIESGNVLFTDFGLSRNFQDTTGSTTSGMTYMTPRYSAPEVAAYDARNTSADIWSLGCVFLEMTLTLKGLNLCYMDEFFERTGTR
ncbi:kinase-like protein, partial [Mytilinidion resinicola]